jgi:hypothetical protein
MVLTVKQSATAVCPRVPASFLGAGGVEPYLYEVLAGGAGGSIDPATGAFVAPPAFSLEPTKRFDTIRVTDYEGATAEARIMVGSPLMLLCEIIQREMGLADGRVYLWDQKIMQPKDAGLYVAVSMPAANPIGSSNRFNSDTNESEQFVTMQGVVDVDLISRDASARDRKEGLILAFDSDYARRQQDANSFYIGKLSTRFTNLSEIDGAAIPYRYKATVKIQYVYTKAQETQYFSQFQTSGEVSTEQAFGFEEQEQDS